MEAQVRKVGRLGSPIQTRPPLSPSNCHLTIKLPLIARVPVVLKELLRKNLTPWKMITSVNPLCRLGSSPQNLGNNLRKGKSANVLLRNSLNKSGFPRSHKNAISNCCQWSRTRNLSPLRDAKIIRSAIAGLCLTLIAWQASTTNKYSNSSVSKMSSLRTRLIPEWVCSKKNRLSQASTLKLSATC